VEKKIIKQGKQVKIIVEITIHKTNNLAINYLEKITPGCTIDQNELLYPIPEPKYNPVVFTYWLTPIIHGNTRFAGGKLIFSDFFFILSLDLSGKRYTNPNLKVEPVPQFGNEKQTIRLDGIESGVFSLLEGISTHSFREYHPGDDLRRIDWKLSAKHKTLYVREYSNIHNNLPLIIVDLPDKDHCDNNEGFQKILHSITGIIYTTIENRLNLNLLLISGPNIIDVLLDENNYEIVMELLRSKFHPSIRVKHLYRVKPRSKIRQDIKNMKENCIPTSNTIICEFNKKKIQFFYKVLMDSKNNRFTMEISKILHLVSPAEIFVFSLCEGDLSHIQEIILEARYQKIPFRLKTPVENNVRFRENLGQIIKSEIIEGV